MEIKPKSEQISKFLLEKHLYSLAKGGTFNNEIMSQICMVFGTGTKALTQKQLRILATIKHNDISFFLSLVDYTREFYPKLENRIWNSFHCMSKIIVAGDRQFTKRCKNKICTNCRRLSSHNLVSKILPIVCDWEDCRLLTLTAKSSTINSFKKDYKHFQLAFNRLRDRIQKKCIRSSMNKPKYIYSYEFAINIPSKTISIHLHIILQGLNTALLIKNEWTQGLLKTPLETSPKGQHITNRLFSKNDKLNALKYISKDFIATIQDRDNFNSNKFFTKAFCTVLSGVEKKHLIRYVGLKPKQRTKAHNEFDIVTQPSLLSFSINYGFE